MAGSMALQTLLGKLGQISFLLMDVVAGRTGHLPAGAKAFAVAEQRDLIPVHIRLEGASVSFRAKILIQLLTRLVGESRLDWLRRARMAQTAIVQSPVSGKARRIENVLSSSLCRVRSVMLDMSLTFAVAFFTGDA